MKKNLLVRTLSCLLAGLLLAETPIQALAAQDSVLEKSEEGTVAEGENAGEISGEEEEMPSAPGDDTSLNTQTPDSEGTGEQDNPAKEPETPGDVPGDETPTEQPGDASTVPGTDGGESSSPQDTENIQPEADIKEDSFLLTGALYDSEAEYYTQDMDTLLAMYEDWSTELAEALKNQTEELELADRKAAVEVLQDLLTYIVNTDDTGSYVLLKPEVVYTYIEKSSSEEGKEPVREVQKVTFSYLTEDELKNLNALTAPQNLQAEGDEHSVRLTWDMAEGATAYEVELYDEEKEDFIPLQIVTENEYVHDSLESGESYTYRVRAVRQQELLRSMPEYSDYSEKAEGRTTPGVPGVTCEAVEAGIVLSWEKVQGADGYRIYCAGEEQPFANTKELTYTVSGLSAGTEYSYEVSAYSGSEDKIQEGKRSSAVYGMAVLPKVSVSVQKISYHQFQVSWSLSVPEAEYEVYRKAEGGDSQLIYTAPAGTTDFADNSVEFNTAYYYWVRPVVKTEGRIYYGDFSEEISGMSNLAVVQMKSVATSDAQSLNISWNPVEGAAGYEIYRSMSAGSGFSHVASVDANTVNYTDKGLTTGTRYYYQVRAYAAAGGKTTYGDFSAETSGVVKLSQVTGLNVTMTKVNTLQLSWNGVSDAKTYEVYYSTSPNSGYKRLTSTKKTTYKFSRAKCGMTYYFKVRTYQKIGKVKHYSDDSIVVSGKTVLTGAPSIYVYRTKYDNITIKWKKVKDAKKYEIYYSTSPDGPYVLLKTQGGTSFTHKKLTTGMTYYYKVRPVRDYYYGEYSNVTSARPVLGTLEKLKVLSGKNQLKVSWRKVSGTSNYVILRSDSASGEYKEIARTRKTSYTDKGLGDGATYYYKVYAIAGIYQTNVVGPLGQTTKAPKPVKPPVTPPSRPDLDIKYHGVDVSSYQGKIDWNAVADDGIDFAMIRILTGKHTANLSVDSRFEYNYSQARAAGIKVGVYRYSYATTRTKARQEAERILEVLDGRKLNYPIVLDMEDSTVLNGTTREKRTQIIQTYKEIIEGAGYKFAVYANKTWLENYIEPEALKGVDVWLARWRSLSSGPGYNGPGNLTMWQYTDRGSVNGISGYVDRNVSYKRY